MTAATALIPVRLLTESIQYEEREAVKAAARLDLERPSATFEERQLAALLIVSMWHARNRDMCPDFEVYVRHLLAADAPYPHGGTLHEWRFGADVVAWLIGKYGLASPCFIRPGGSDFMKRLKRPKKPGPLDESATVGGRS